MKTTLLKSLVALLLFAAAPAFADKTIIIDGSNADWSGVTGCLNGPFGTSGIILTRVCFENDNASATSGAGSLFSLYEASATLPTDRDSYFGFVVDKDQDGQLTSNDEVFVAYYPAGSSSTPTALAVYQYNNFNTPTRTYATTADCGGASGANGWSAKRSGKSVELAVSYGCLGLTQCNDARIIQGGVYPELNVSSLAFYNGTTDQMAPVVTSTPEAQLFTAVSGNAKVTMKWNNPIQHNGVVLLRSLSAIDPNLRLTDKTAYTVGAQVGSVSTGGKVVYADTTSSCTTSSYVDTPLLNSTRYYYRLFNYYQSHTYAAGGVPTSQGIFSEPTTRVTPAPLYCYSVGLTNLQQPVTLLNSSIFTSGNVGAVTASRTSADVNVDGQETWRPVQLGGSVQSRFPVVPLVNRSSKYILTGDQSGNGCVIDAATGANVWSGTGCRSIGTNVQAQAGVQLFTYANAAFQAAQPGRDLVFFATRDASTTANKVVALSSVDGSTVWSYPSVTPDLNMVSGGMLVDYDNNRLWVAAFTSGRKQASVRVLDTLTGAELKQISLGNVSFGVNEDFTSKQAYIVDDLGLVSGIDLAAPFATIWTFQLPSAATSYVFPTGKGFIASLQSGAVARYTVNGAVVTRMWTSPIAGPSGVTVQYTTNKIFVGSSDGKVHQLNADTGADEKQVTLSGTRTGTPTIDTTALRLSVGTSDGRLCVFQLPF